MDLRCAICRQRPEEIEEYKVAAAEHDLNLTPSAYVYLEEGTLNTRLGLFLCTKCYISINSPSSPNGVIAIADEPYYEEFN